jgi:hypothetical protein
MQRVLEEKEARKNSFAESIKDVSAWFPGYGGNTSESLATRAKTREEEIADIFQMRNQIAQIKSKQDLTRNRSQRMGLAAPGVGTGTEGNAGAPTAPAAGGAPAVTGQQAEWQRVVASLPMGLQSQAQNAAENQDWDTFDRIVMEGVKARSENEKDMELVDRLPEGQKKEMLKRKIFDKAYGPQTVVGSSGQKYDYSLPGTFPENVLPPSERTTPPSATTTTSPVQGSGADQAKAAGVPVISGTRTNEQQWKLYDDWVASGRKGNPVARPGTSKHETGNALDVDTSKLTDAHRQWLTQNGYTQPLPKTDPNHWERVGTATSTTAPTNPTERKSQDDLKKEEETFKANIALDAEAAKKFMENTEPMSLRNREVQNVGLETWIKKWGDNTRIIGLLNEPTLTNAVLTVLDEGIKTPNGQISIGGIEDALQKLIPGVRGAEVEARQELQQILGARILDVVQRTKGSSSDKDWNAYKVIAGSTKNGIDLINKLQKYDRLSIDMDKKQRRLFDDMPDKSRNYTEFQRNPEKRRMDDEVVGKVYEIAKSQYLRKKTPARPQNVPEGAKYSPSTNSWWFNGKKVG